MVARRWKRGGVDTSGGRVRKSPGAAQLTSERAGQGSSVFRLANAAMISSWPSKMAGGSSNGLDDSSTGLNVSSRTLSFLIRCTANVRICPSAGTYAKRYRPSFPNVRR